LHMFFHLSETPSFLSYCFAPASNRVPIHIDDSYLAFRTLLNKFLVTTRFSEPKQSWGRLAFMNIYDRTSNKAVVGLPLCMSMIELLTGCENENHGQS
jgi:hypothetical protein